MVYLQIHPLHISHEERIICHDPFLAFLSYCQFHQYFSTHLITCLPLPPHQCNQLHLCSLTRYIPTPSAQSLPDCLSSMQSLLAGFSGLSCWFRPCLFLTTLPARCLSGSASKKDWFWPVQVVDYCVQLWLVLPYFWIINWTVPPVSICAILGFNLTYITPFLFYAVVGLFPSVRWGACTPVNKQLEK